MDEQRIIELETKISFQEDAIKELSSTIYAQQIQLDQLKKTCSLLNEYLKNHNDAQDIAPFSNGKPPHY